MSHVERKSELKRRRHRRQKIRKLRAKMARAKVPGDQAALLKKIHAISPFWLPPGTPAPSARPAKPAETKKK